MMVVASTASSGARRHRHCRHLLSGGPRRSASRRQPHSAGSLPACRSRRAMPSPLALPAGGATGNLARTAGSPRSLSTRLLPSITTLFCKSTIVECHKPVVHPTRHAILAVLRSRVPQGPFEIRVRERREWWRCRLFVYLEFCMH